MLKLNEQTILFRSRNNNALRKSINQDSVSYINIQLHGIAVRDTNKSFPSLTTTTNFKSFIVP